MTAADKPRADLVALFDAFAALPEGHAMLSLFGSEHEETLREWAERHARSVRVQVLENATDGRWTHIEVRVIGGWINVHCDNEVTAQADQQVLARVQAAMDGEPAPCPECDGPADHCADCGVPNGRPHEAFCHQQPEAAEGSV